MTESFEDADPDTMDFNVVENGPTPDGFTKVTLHGHLDAEGAPMLAERLRALLESGARKIELDFTDLRFISSTGIGTIVAAAGEFRDVGGEIAVSALSPAILEVFESLDLLDYMVVR